MGYIKEPVGVDFTVDPTPLTKEDRKMISDVIAYYKATGRKKIPAVTTRTKQTRRKAEPTQKEILQGIKQAFKEVKQIKAGKLKGRPIKDVLNEL